MVGNLAHPTPRRLHEVVGWQTRQDTYPCLEGAARDPSGFRIVLGQGASKRYLGNLTQRAPCVADYVAVGASFTPS